MNQSKQVSKMQQVTQGYVDLANKLQQEANEMNRELDELLGEDEGMSATSATSISAPNFNDDVTAVVDDQVTSLQTSQTVGVNSLSIGDAHQSSNQPAHTATDPSSPNIPYHQYQHLDQPQDQAQTETATDQPAENQQMDPPQQWGQ